MDLALTAHQLGVRAFHGSFLTQALETPLRSVLLLPTFKKSSPENVLIGLRERENIDWLLSVHAPTGELTCRLLVYGTMLPLSHTGQVPYFLTRKQR